MKKSARNDFQNWSPLSEFMTALFTFGQIIVGVMRVKRRTGGIEMRKGGQEIWEEADIMNMKSFVMNVIDLLFLSLPPLFPKHLEFFTKQKGHTIV